MKLNNQETTMVLAALLEYIDLMEDGEQTVEYTNYMLENGLGSAIRKLSKGRNGENVFAKYPCHRESYNYLSFEEWKAARKKKVTHLANREREENEGHNV